MRSKLRRGRNVDIDDVIHEVTGVGCAYFEIRCESDLILKAPHEKRATRRRTTCLLCIARNR